MTGGCTECEVPNHELKCRSVEEGEGGRAGRERHSKSPELDRKERVTEEDDSRLHDSRVRGRQKDRQRDDRGRRERSIEEDWGGARRARGRGEFGCSIMILNCVCY